MRSSSLSVTSILLTTLLSILSTAPEAPGQESSGVLQGGIQDGASLKPHVEVTTGSQKASQLHGAGAIQFSGSMYPAGHRPVPQYHPLLNAQIGQTHGTIPFIYSHHSTSATHPLFSQAHTSPPPRPAPWNPNSSAVSHTPANGLMTYSPGLAVKEIPQPKHMTPDPYHHLPIIRHSPYGAVAFSPGYQVHVSVPGSTREGLGGSWSAQESSAKGAAGLNASPLLLKGISARPVTASWQQWFRLTAGAIYARWKHAEVGPGTAHVQVTVTVNQDISGIVEDFTPAEGVERDVKAETEFREAALRSVDLISRYEIPRFPRGSDRKKVVFNVELRRTVTGEAGFDVQKAAP
ncbi:MAG: hypothetical protein IPM23_12540 [Candidatus Melainabacteria bacterium]|nr:hypothetical protein [Candidatus Melainabacteria bacterium]